MKGNKNKSVDLVHGKKSKISKWINKKNIMLSTLATTLVSVPMVFGAGIIHNNLYSYEFEGKKFSSLKSIENYVVSNSKKETTTKNVSTNKWSMTLNGKTLYFDDPHEARDYLFNKYVSLEQYSTSLDLNQYVDAGTNELLIPSNKLSQLHKGKYTQNDLITLYEGKHQSIYESELDAKKSFFSPKEGYYFDNMFFNSTQDLRQYLISDFLLDKNKSNTSFNSIVLLAPNGNKSAPIKLNFKDPSQTINEINSFIEFNSDIILDYTNSNTNEKISINNKNKIDVLDKISTKDLSHKKIYSNQGESTYILDISKLDQNDLIGPYFYKGSLDVGSFSNRSMWKPVYNDNRTTYVSSAIDDAIGTFISTIINDDRELLNQENKTNEVPTIFRTILTDSNGNFYDKLFMEKLFEFNKKLGNDLIKLNKDLSETKRYNSLYKLPILFSYLIDRLSKMNNSQYIMDLTIDYFDNVVSFIQETIELIIMDDSLLIRSNDGKRFNLNSIFDFKNPMFDINANFQSLIEEIKSYDKLVAAIVTYNFAINNINMTGGLAPFESIDYSILFNYGMIKEIDFISIDKQLKNIYKTYSQLNYNDLILEYVKNSTDSKINKLSSLSANDIEKQLDIILTTKTQQPYNLFIKSTIAKSTILFGVAREILLDEIKEYKANGKLDYKGLLYKIEKRVSYLINLIESNPQIDPYQAYLAILIDIRLNNEYIFGSTNSVSYDLYVKNIGRLSFAAMGSAYLFARTIKEIYNHYGSGSINGWFDNPVMNKAKNLLSSIYEKVKKAGNSISRKLKSTYWSYNLDTGHISSKNALSRWWSGYDFYSKISVGISAIVDLFLPVFGTSFAIFELVFLFINIFREEHINVSYVYTAIDGTEFIWNGGLLISKYLGINTDVVSDISSAIFVDPIQITTPQFEEYYLFNGEKFYDERSLKLANVNYLLSSKEILNSKFNRMYTFDNIKNINPHKYSSLKELSDVVLKELNINKKNDGTYDLSNVNKKSKYLSETAYLFDSGINVSSNNSIDIIANNIVENIRPTKVVKLPKIVDGYFVEDTSNDFAFPGIVWYQDGKIDNTHLASEYLIDNSSNEVIDGVNPIDGIINDDLFITPDRKTALQKSYNLLFEQFDKSFMANSKTVLKNEYLLLTNKFNHLNKFIELKNIYCVDIPGFGVVRFLNPVHAQNYLIKNANFTEVLRQEKQTRYNYNGLEFKSTKDIQNWIKYELSLK